MKIETIDRLIDKNQGTTFISYIDKDGNPVTTAMLSPRKRVGIKYFYFLTNMNSNKVSAYKNNNRGSIYFVDKCFY